MADAETPTWRQARIEAEDAAREWAADHWDTGCDVSDAAHEYADGTADVIYTYRARAIWADSSEVQKWEDEVEGMGPGADIDNRITLCVYFAIRNAFENTAHAAIEAEREAAEVAS